jgi:5'-nucleotidase (lipoprotein e(P4) family)
MRFHMVTNHCNLISLCTAMFALAVLGQNGFAQEKPNLVQKATDQQKMESPPYRGLDASLFMLTSAEYRACCIQTFRFAELVAHQNLLARPASSKQPAVVMDLDETILDNGWFQSQQIREQLAFDQDRWSKWEQQGADQVRLVPGAKRFFVRLQELKICPLFITNRNDDARVSTMSALKRLGVEVPEGQLLCADKNTGSNKTSRREKFESSFDILLYVGDNLRDFDERFRFGESGIDGRSNVVDELSHQFGSKWIILPNPSYGEWTKAFKNSPEDVNLLYK